MAQARQMVQMLKSANNPQQMVNQMVNNNPQVKQFIEQYGDPKTAFYKLAEQRGINPDEIINMLNT
jgi:hypothetical protein